MTALPSTTRGVRLRPEGSPRRPRRGLGPTGVVAWFVLGSLAALAVVLIGSFSVLRSVAVDEARRDARERVNATGHLVEAAGLTDGLLRRDPEAIATLDDVVVGRVIAGSIVRVKVWDARGTVLYSDQPELIGDRFPLEDDQRIALRDGITEVELSDLSKPENQLERPEGQLIEAYTRIRTPNGTPVLFETYQRFSTISANGNRLLDRISTPLVAGLLLLLLVQVPLAWVLARRARRAADDRAELLAYAVRASEVERSRIARDLHDGVVQSLAGTAFGLVPLAAAARRDGRAEEAATLSEVTDRLQQSVRDLRTLLVEIHPPNLATSGLQAALSDLLSPLERRGMRTHLQAGELEPHPADAVLYRVALESVRNAVAHASPTTVSITVEPSGGRRRVIVVDDGVGIEPGRLEAAPGEGHVGLRLLRELVELEGGALTITSAPGAGTTVTAEVPT